MVLKNLRAVDSPTYLLFVACSTTEYGTRRMVSPLPLFPREVTLSAHDNRKEPLRATIFCVVQGSPGPASLR